MGIFSLFKGTKTFFLNSVNKIGLKFVEKKLKTCSY